MAHHLGGEDKVLQINVTEHEAKEFETLWESSKHTADCCEISAFRIHLLGTPACAWNKSSAAILTRYLATEWKYRDDDYTGRKVITDAIMVHIRTLHRQHGYLKLPEGQRVAKRKEDAKESRRQTVSSSFRPWKDIC